MKIKKYKKISKWDLKKYNNHYATIILPSWQIIDGWKIFIAENWDINYLSFNPDLNWWGENIPPFPYSYILYSYFENDEDINNESFQAIHIQIIN